MYMAAISDIQKDAELKEEFQWARTRALWVPLKNAFFKKEGGGQYEPKDLLKLSFDPKEEKAKPVSFKEVKERLGSRIKKDGK